MGNDDRLSEESETAAPDAQAGEPASPSTGRVLAVIGGFFAVAALFVGGIAYFAYQAVSSYQAEQEEIRQAELQKQEEIRKQREERDRIRREQMEAQRKIDEENNRLRQAEALRDHNERMADQNAEREQRDAARREQRRKMEEERLRRVQLTNARTLLTGLQRTLFEQLRTGDTPDALIVPDSDNGSGLSWRVHLLPAIGLNNLYEQFNLEEPWDSPQNRALLSQMPPAYGETAENPDGLTRIRSLLRLDGPTEELIRVKDITDGLEQTALLIRVGQAAAIPWTQPDHMIPISLDEPSPLGLEGDDPMMFTMCSDNITRSVSGMPEELLKAMASPSGGEHLDLGVFLDNAHAHHTIEWSPYPAAMPQPDRPDLNADALHEQAGTKLATLSKALADYITQSGKDSKPPTVRCQLSWRVLLLPHLGHTDLFEKFELSEPWNSETNLALIKEMPAVFRLDTTPGRCRFRLWTPQNCRRGFGGIPAPGAVTDPPELTPLLYLAAPHRADTWTRPDYPQYSRLPLHQSLGWPLTSSVLSATLGGTLFDIPGGLHASKLAALTSVSGGESFDLQDFTEFPNRSLRLVPKIKPAAPIDKLVLAPKPNLPPGTQLRSPESVSRDEKLRRISIALHRCHDENRRNIRQDGLSWRVHLLPYLEERILYQKFKLDEPWDSVHNMALLEFMPEVFQTWDDQTTTTSYQMFTGPNSLVFGNRSFFQSKDGHTNSILVLKVGKDMARPWTQPDDLDVTAEIRMADCVGPEEELTVAIGDGSQIRLPRHTPNEIFRALGTAGGREIIDPGTIGRWAAHERGEHVVSSLMASQWQMNQMKRIGLAMMNYHDVYQYYPPAIKLPRSDSILPLRCCMLSWRVLILPFLGHRQLFSQFRLDEPWDSPHNIQLLDAMPEFFRDLDSPSDSNTTRLMTFTGQHTPFPELGRGPRRRDITDGTHATICLFLAPKDSAVPWTKPEDFSVDPDDGNSSPLAELLKEDMFVAMFDGSIRKLPPGTDEKTLRAIISPSGEELVNTRALFAR